VTVRALGRDGPAFEMEAEGLAAVCVQHEMDHLLGKVFVEYLSPLKRDRIRTKMLKKTREEQGIGAPLMCDPDGPPCASPLPARRSSPRVRCAPWHAAGHDIRWC
jgi:hypothetical protein